MKINLTEVLKALGLPVAITTILAGVLLLFGIDLDTVLEVAGSMVGLQLIFGLLIDLLKTVGLVQAGEAPIWSAGASLLTVIGVAVALGFKPDFDFPALDHNLGLIAQIFTLAITFVTQMLGTKSAHVGLVEGLGQRQFQLTRPGLDDKSG